MILVCYKIVSTDDPEPSRPMPPGFILLAGLSCRRPIRVGGAVEPPTGAMVKAVVKAPLEEGCYGWVGPRFELDTPTFEAPIERMKKTSTKRIRRVMWNRMYGMGWDPGTT